MNWSKMVRNLSPICIKLLSLFLFFLSCDKGVEPPAEPNYHNKILFTSRVSGKPQLYIADPTGENIVQVTNEAIGVVGGRWSSDAKKILYAAIQNCDDCPWEIAVIDPDGKNRKTVAEGTLPVWAPDGKRFVSAYPFFSQA